MDIPTFTLGAELTPEQAAFLDEYGFVKFGGFAKPDEVEMLRGELGGDSHHLEAGDFDALLLESAENAAGKAALEGVRLEQQEGAFHGAGLSRRGRNMPLLGHFWGHFWPGNGIRPIHTVWTVRSRRAQS